MYKVHKNPTRFDYPLLQSIISAPEIISLDPLGTYSDMW